MDKYYTSPDVSIKCVDILSNLIPFTSDDIFLEPSAGEGSFVNALIKYEVKIDNIYAIDIEDHLSHRLVNFYHGDFLTHKGFPALKILKKGFNVIGNPPFGKNSSMAVKFFNRAASFSPNIIAFIVPRSFQKPSISNRLDRNYHLIHMNVLEKNSFIYENIIYDVPCIWTIWVHKDYNPSEEKRGEIKFDLDRIRGKLRDLLVKGPTETNLVKFVKPDECTVIIQRVGVAAGKVSSDRKYINSKKTSKNFYFVLINSDVIENLDLSNCERKYWTAGMPSLTKSDVVEEIHKFLNIPY
jgi:hypothetical protein